VYKVAALAINGTMTYDQRAKVVGRFKTDPLSRVLILSKVGTVGLNLTEADTIILLVSRLRSHPGVTIANPMQDQQWSYADENQAIGRIHRQGQTRPVTAYHILASGTVDYFVASLARGKAIVSEAFLAATPKQKSTSTIVRSLRLSD
jgi:SNF2 family DNA or RNA helicase